MTVYKRGDIILVPFPFSNQTSRKKRPAVVISSDVYKRVSSDIIIIAITSKFDEIITAGECIVEDWEGAGLLKPSATKPAISTIEAKLVIKQLGSLSHRDLTSLEVVLRKLLDL